MKGKSYEINIHICTYEKSEYRFSVKTGTSVIRKRLFSENAGMGTGKYESTDGRIGKLYGGCICTSCSLRFFYSYQIPKLGKEFDLLQIKDDQIINIELKSGAVSEEAIRKQLMQNRYYLSVLGRSIQSYTYISSQNRLVRLTNHDHIAEADWTELCGSLQKESSDYQGNIDDLFQAELYLISPITEPARFLKKEYFLTSQQRDIQRQILKKLRISRFEYFCFTGLPGTGKTLLLYDIAMKLSRRQQICMIHCGNAGKEWKILHKRLQRIAFLSDNQLTENTVQFW